MKPIWTILTTLALANLLGLAAFAVWLGASDRLDVPRIQRIRQVLAEPRHEEQERLDRERAAADEAARKKAEEDKLAVPPESAAARIARQEQADRVQLQHILKIEEEQRALRETLDSERARIERDQKELAAKQKVFSDYLASLAEIEGAKQFKKALSTLQGQTPRDGKNVLQAMIKEGKIEQVVSYLSAMEDRVRTKVIGEFLKEDHAVAADLLERLRTRGITLPSGPEVAAK